MPVLGPADNLSKLLPTTTWGKQENCAELAEQAGLWRRARIVDLIVGDVFGVRDDPDRDSNPSSRVLRRFSAAD
jgi:hypothetical protein